MSNVLSWNQALEQGLEPREYSWKDVPTGEYQATLDFKIWAKNAVAVSCYFTKIDSNEKIQLTVYRTHTDREYILDGVDFRDSPTNVAYKLIIETNSKGNIKLKSAVPIN
uniref:hypothetical protein n=1 Tax=Fulvivirga sp. TaxID=1931237 RepID=UPI004049B9D6